MRRYTLPLAVIGLPILFTACEKPADDVTSTSEANAKPEVQTPATPETTSDSSASASSLNAILLSQPEDVQARYPFRHPEETLTFFGIEPGMTVVEALPGGGWYTKILLPYLGEEGKLVGANYALDMWPKFGFFKDEQIEEFKTWTTDWPVSTKEWGIENGADVSAFELGSLPEELHESADAVLFIRAMHNLARFNGDGGYLDTTIEETYKILKPGGIVGIVQHEGREDMPDEWAGGQNGYLKKSFVVEKMQAAGFELVDETDINQNPKDQPTESDVVWRLPPTMYTSQDDPELRAKMTPLGESNRMTLKFRKPG